MDEILLCISKSHCVSFRNKTLIGQSVGEIIIIATRCYTLCQIFKNEASLTTYYCVLNTTINLI